jgi:hypothetical protein
MNGRTILALVGGFAAGIATGAYLASEKDSDVRRTIDDVLHDLGREVDELFAEGRSKLSEIAGDFREGGKEIKRQVKPKAAKI